MSHTGSKRASKQPRSKSKSVVFDEDNIARTLHPEDKTYGYMKIDQPNTPYPREEAPVSSKELRKKLEKLKEMELGEDSASNLALNDSESEHKIQRKNDFEARRKANYSGEYRKAKEAAKQITDTGNVSQDSNVSDKTTRSITKENEKQIN